MSIDTKLNKVRRDDKRTRNLLVQLLNHAKEVEIQSAKDGLYEIDDSGRTSACLSPEDIKVVEDKLQDIIDLIKV